MKNLIILTISLLVGLPTYALESILWQNKSGHTVSAGVEQAGEKVSEFDLLPNVDSNEKLNASGSIAVYFKQDSETVYCPTAIDVQVTDEATATYDGHSCQLTVKGKRATTPPDTGVVPISRASSSASCVMVRRPSITASSEGGGFEEILFRTVMVDGVPRQIFGDDMQSLGPITEERS